MQEFFQQAFLIMLMLSAVIFYPVGGYQTLVAVFGETVWQKRRAREKLNAKPDSVLDATIRALLGLIHSEPQGWVTFVCDDANYYQSRERIRRLDGKVVISEYTNKNSITLTLEGIGKIEAHEIKPELVDKLVETCSTFKVLVATHALLKPETLVTRELTE